MVVTCTIRSIQDQLSQGIVVSYRGKISLHPFFITFATEKIALCLCKICLNTRMLFEPLIAQAKRDGDPTTESITEFPCTLVLVRKVKMGITIGNVSLASAKNVKIRILCH